MLMLLLRFVGFALIIMFTAWIVPGISVENFKYAFFLAIVISLINLFIKPVLLFITLPINILTLGLFTLIINAVLLIFASHIVPGFHIDGFLSALLGSIIISILTVGLNLPS